MSAFKLDTLAADSPGVAIVPGSAQGYEAYRISDSPAVQTR